ncbi:MAG: DJ-1/PfpI family protein [Caldiserica bacterium]|nr:DJ-1/PfpI family protein [Caldisericota bacterium]
MRWLILLFLLFSIPAVSPAQNNRVLFLIAAQNFRDEELLITRKMLEEGEFKVVIASSSSPSIARGMLGTKIKPDIPVSRIQVEDYRAIVLIGGAGAKEYWNNSLVHKLLRQALQKGKVIGAICIAPVTLAKAGILKNRRATVWWSSSIDLRKALKHYGAKFVDKNVVIDGKIITANGPSASEEFGRALLKLLQEGK